MVYIYPGAAHIHTKYSDGTGTISEIASAAKKAGLAWIIITDHNSLEGLKNKEEGWYNGVAVLIGEEISPENSDHYLAFDIKESISPDQPPQDYINQVKQQGGVGFIAHPDEKIDRKSGYKPLRWSDWNVEGFDGLEIWNHLSDWVDNYDPKKAVQHFLFHEQILKGPTPATLKWWDDLNNKNTAIIPAIGGVDVHCLHQNHSGFKLKVFPYVDSFKTVTNFLFLNSKLSKDFEEAKQQILTGLKSGKNIISNRTQSKKIPLFYVEDNEQRVYVGGKIKINKYTKLYATLPKKALVKIINDGQSVWEYESRTVEFDGLSRGKYRLEAYYKGKPWFFTNPIKVIE